MVKKYFSVGLLGLVLLGGVFSGCNQAGAPVMARTGAVLKLTVPKPPFHSLSSPRRPKAGTVSLGGDGYLAYYLSQNGQSPISGAVSFTGSETMGTITLDLPAGGEWFIAAEWDYDGDGIIPQYIGADKVNVQGTTTVTLDMGSLTTSCYQGYLADLSSSSNYQGDSFSFNSGSYSYSYNGGGDVMAVYDTTTTNSEYLSGVPAPVTTPGVTPSPVPTSSFAYLGNGIMADFAQIPSGTVFYPDTIQAKTAVSAVNGPALAYNDVFGVKVPSTNATVWLQVTQIYSTPGGSYVDFLFRYNGQGLDYMKFDETTYGHNYCNQNTFLP